MRKLSLIAIFFGSTLASGSGFAEQVLPLKDSVELIRDKFQVLFLTPGPQNQAPLPRDFVEYAYPEFLRRMEKGMEIYKTAVQEILQEVEEYKSSYVSLNAHLSPEEAQRNLEIANRILKGYARGAWSYRLESAIELMIDTVTPSIMYKLAEKFSSVDGYREFYAPVLYEATVLADKAVTMDGRCGSKLCTQLTQIKLISYLNTIGDTLLRPYSLTDLYGNTLSIGERLFYNFFGRKIAIAELIENSSAYRDLPYKVDETFRPPSPEKPTPNQTITNESSHKENVNPSTPIRPLKPSPTKKGGRG